MKQGGGTGEQLEMETVKAGNNTLVVEDIDSWVAQIICLCSVYFQYYYLMLAHYHLGVVVSQIAHWLESYWLSSVEIRSSTSYLNRSWS